MRRRSHEAVPPPPRRARGSRLCCRPLAGGREARIIARPSDLGASEAGCLDLAVTSGLRSGSCGSSAAHGSRACLAYETKKRDHQHTAAQCAEQGMMPSVRPTRAKRKASPSTNSSRPSASPSSVRTRALSCAACQQGNLGRQVCCQRRKHPGSPSLALSILGSVPSVRPLL